MGINNLFNIATSGYTAQRLAIEVTSENIANVNTPGYSRQRAIMETAPTTTSNGFPLGTGVKLAGVQRSYDDLLQRQIVAGNSNLGYDQARQTALDQIEPSFNELSTDGLGKAMDDFFNAWDDLTLNPQGSPERQEVLTRAQVLVDSFNQMNSSLNSVVDSADKSLSGVSAEINDKTKNIASLNYQILTTERLGGNAGELRDQRDYLLQELATKVGISFQEQSDSTVTVTLAGDSSRTLVQGGEYATMYTYPNGTSNELYLTPTGNPPADATTPPDAVPSTDAVIYSSAGTSTIDKIGKTGELGGILEIRDTTVPAYLDKLNEMAKNLGDEVNKLHMAGYGLDSSIGTAFFTGVPTSPTTATGDLTSGQDVITNTDTTNLRVGMGVAGGAGMPGGAKIIEIINGTSFRISKPATAASASQALTFSGVESAAIGLNPNLTLDKIAAADADPVIGGKGNNKNALQLAGLKNTALSFTSGGNSTTTMSGYFTAFVSEVGIDVESATNSATHDSSFLKQLNSLRDSKSGVSLDEELTNLTNYQRAFQASARVINAATEMMDTVLGMVR